MKIAHLGPETSTVHFVLHEASRTEMLNFGGNLLKNCRFVHLTTLIFVLSVSKSMEFGKLKFVRNRWAAEVNDIQVE